MNINATIRQIARQELAPLQLKVWEAYHVYGVDSFREIARQLDLSRTTVTDAYDGACKNLRQFGIRVTPDGTHYQEPECPPSENNSKSPSSTSTPETPSPSAHTDESHSTKPATSQIKYEASSPTPPS